MPGAKEAEMQALPDTPLSWTTASQGGPDPCQREVGALEYRIYPCGCRLPARRAISSRAEITSYPLGEAAALILIIPQSHCGEQGLGET